MTFVTGIKHVLCPTDFSDDSRCAVEHAVAVAAAFHASVTAYHVMPQTLMHPELFPYLKEPLLVPPEVEQRARERLSAFVVEIPSRGVSIASRLESGEAVPRILELARALPADLVTLGYHGRRGLGKWLLGSVTERVLHDAPCSVLTVASPPRALAPGETLPYGRILVAVDFSEGSLHALREAVAIWRKAKGELVAVHVLEADDGGEADPVAARRRLEAELPADAPEGSRHEVVVVERGQPHRELRREAEEREVDLVVMGARGRRAGHELRLGSTAHQIVRTVGAAVLTVPLLTETA